MYPLYIDPGTGSMLFSVLLGLVTTIYFVGKTWLIKLKLIFAGRRLGGRSAARHEAVAIFSEDIRYWPVFEPILREIEGRGVAVRYLVADRDDPAFGMRYQHVRIEVVGRGNLAWARLNLLEADILLMTTPGLDVYQLKRSKFVKHYCHVLHSVDDASSYRLFGLDYFDSVLLSGAYQADAIRRLESARGLPAKRLEVIGCPYLDVAAENLARLPARLAGAEFTVLVAPSWGDSGLLKRYGMALLRPLAETGWQVVIRPHPQSRQSEAAMLASLAADLNRYPNVSWNDDRDNVAILSRADALVSDFSGVIFDYAFLFGGPVLYATADMDLRPYDAGDLVEPPWKFGAVAGFGRELRPEEFSGIGEAIRAAMDDPRRREAISSVKRTAWQHPGESGRRAADFLLAVAADSKPVSTAASPAAS